MIITVEGKNFRAACVRATVLAVEASAGVPEVLCALSAGGPSVRLRLPKGDKTLRTALLALENGGEAVLPLPGTCAVAPGAPLELHCLGPEEAVGGNSAFLQVYAVSAAGSWTHEFMDARSLMKICGVTSVSEYEKERYPLKKVCKVSLIVFLVALACFSFLMHLFTDTMGDLVQRLPEALFMSVKFGAVAAAVVAIGGWLYVKSSNDYNKQKKLAAYGQLFERAMTQSIAAQE